VRLNSRAWFKAVDADEGGALEKSEVVDALCATLPVDPELLWKAFDGELWEQWDTDHSGRISLDAFERPGKGLLHFVLYSMPSLQQAGTSTMAPVPDIADCREGWFRHWDENSKHVLEYLQFLRALVRTLRLEGAKEDAGVLRSVLTTVWQEFGLTMSMSESAAEAPSNAGRNSFAYKPVSLSLFCERPDGFCDALLDALQKEFGLAKFRRIKQRAYLLQQSAGFLKKELRKLNINRPDLLEKDELVSAILDAQENGVQTNEVNSADSAAGLPAPSAPPAVEIPRERACPEGLKQLSLKQLKERLQAYGIPYGHCVERRDLEDLLIRQGDTGVEALPEHPPPRTGNAKGMASESTASHPTSSTGSNSQGASSMGGFVFGGSQQQAPMPQTMGASAFGGGRVVVVNQPVPIVTEPPDREDQSGMKRCMQSCVLQ
jgi:hypothetical protein